MDTSSTTDSSDGSSDSSSDEDQPMPSDDNVDLEDSSSNAEQHNLSENVSTVCFVVS